MDLEENVNPDKDDRHAMVIYSENGIAASENGDDGVTADEEIDPLDAFMNSIVLLEVKKLNNAMTTQTVDDNKMELKKKDKKEERINGEQPRKVLTNLWGELFLVKILIQTMGTLRMVKIL